MLATRRMGIGFPVVSGSPTAILYVDANGNLAQSATNFFWDYTNNRLAINALNPQGALVVGGTQSGNAGFEIIAGSGIVAQSVNRTGGVYTSLNFDGDTIAVRPNGTTLWSAASGVISVYGDTKVYSASKTFWYNADSTNYYYIDNVGTGGASNGVLRFIQGNVGERGRFDNAGQFNVYGTASVGGVTNTGYATSFTSSNTANLPAFYGIQYAAGGTLIGSNVGVRGEAYVISGTGYGVGVFGISDGPLASGINIGGYFTASGGGTNYALITGAGNVGIGKDAPTEKLHISGAGNLGVKIDSTNVSLLQMYDGITYANINTYHDGTLRMQSDTTAFNAGTVQFVIKSGNIGVGTATPKNVMHVVGGVQVAGAVDLTTGNGSALYLSYNGGGKIYAITPGSSYDSLITYSDTFQVNTNGTTNAIYVDNAQLVGFGTSSPANRVHIQSASQDTYGLRVGSSSIYLKANGYQIGSVGYDLRLQSDASYDIVLQPDSRKVGIGTTPTTYKLEVSGTTYSTTGFLVNNNQSYKAKNSSGTAIDVFYLDGSNILQFNAQSGGGYVFGINASTAISISSARLVAVGSVTPTSLLHVSAGTASVAPFKLTSGTNLTTAEAGAFEYNGTNLFFTRSGTTREGVLTQSAVTTESVASDTTVTVNINGTTYKLLARA